MDALVLPEADAMQVVVDFWRSHIWPMAKRLRGDMTAADMAPIVAALVAWIITGDSVNGVAHPVVVVQDAPNCACITGTGLSATDPMSPLYGPWTRCKLALKWLSHWTQGHELALYEAVWQDSGYGIGVDSASMARALNDALDVVLAPGGIADVEIAKARDRSSG